MVAPLFAFFLLPFVFNSDVDTLVQICQLAHAFQQRAVVIGRSGKYGAVGLEGDAGAGLVGVAHGLHLVEGFALAVFLLVYLSIAVDVHNHVLTEGVHATHTHTVQTAGHFIAAFVEFAASMQHRHHHLQGRTMLLFVHVHGNTAAIILNSDAVIFVDAYIYLVAVACQSLVDGVVHHLVYQMVQTAEIHVTNIHGGTHAHGFQTLQNGDITRTVFVLLLC